MRFLGLVLMLFLQLHLFLIASHSWTLDRASTQNDMKKNKAEKEDHNQVQMIVISEHSGGRGGGHGGGGGGRGGGRGGRGRQGIVPILGAGRGRPNKTKRHHPHGSACSTAHFQLIMPVFLLAFGFFLI